MMGIHRPLLVCRLSLLASAVLAVSGWPALASGSAPRSQPQVVLIESGEEPRQPLRYDLASMRATEMSMVMDMDMTMSGPMVGSVAQVLPRMITRVALTDVTLLDSERLGYNFRMLSTSVSMREGVDPTTIPALEAALAEVGQVSGSAVIDAQGRTLEVTIDDESVDPSLQPMLDAVSELCMPLPNEAVGVGARWRVEQEIATVGFAIDQHTTYTLLARDGDSFRLGIVVEQRADPQPIEDPSLPPGMTMRLDRYSAQGTGESSVQAGGLVGQGTVQMGSSMAMSIDDGAGNVEPVLEMTMAIRIAVQAPEP